MTDKRMNEEIDIPDEYMGLDGTLHLCDEDKDREKRYVELFTKIHESEFNPYLNDEDEDDFVKPEDVF